MKDIPDRADLGSDPDLLGQLACECCARFLSGLHFAPRKLPFEGQRSPGRPLGQKDSIPVDQQGRDHQLALERFGHLASLSTRRRFCDPPIDTPGGIGRVAPMRLYAGKIDSISAEIINRLVTDGDLEVASRQEAELDVVAVLKEYLRVDREITERAKDILEIRGLGYSHFGRTKRHLAEQKEFGLGEEGITWMINQMLEAFMQSAHIEEIYADDATLRRKIRAILSAAMTVDEELDRQVRDRIKNLQEGTQTWEIEYQKVLEQMKTRLGLKE